MKVALGQCTSIPGFSNSNSHVSAGLTWQDDVTQRVISRELSRLHKVPLRRPAPPISPLAHHQDRTLRPGEAELGRKLQQHLKDMGFLLQTVGTTRLGVQRERPLTQVRPVREGLQYISPPYQCQETIETSPSTVTGGHR